MKNPRETRTCIARAARGSGALRASARCGAAALDFGDVRVAGQLVEIPLCQAHFRKLRDSSDPIALGASWAAAAAGS
ncbi:MAG TPA: hypothetical protein VGK92_00365 [Gaiellales bacterium]